MSNIKTKDSIERTIRTLDRSSDLSSRMKDSYIRTKKETEHGYYAEEDSPEEYASEKVNETVDDITETAVYTFDEQGQKAFNTTKRNIGKAKEHFEHGENRQNTEEPPHYQKQARDYAQKQTQKRNETRVEQYRSESISNAERTANAEKANSASVEHGKASVKSVEHRTVFIKTVYVYDINRIEIEFKFDDLIAKAVEKYM